MKTWRQHRTLPEELTYFQDTASHDTGLERRGVVTYSLFFTSLYSAMMLKRVFGLSIVFADLMLWSFGGDFFNISPPSWLSGPVETFFVTGVKRSSGELIFMKYPVVRLVIFAASIVVGILMWILLNRTRIGMLIRAGVDDRDMLAATGVKIQFVFLGVFTFGAGLAGIAGVVGGTFQSIAPGEDIRFLLASLVVVIVGGMGSISGAAIGALIVGLAEQFGSVYFPTYAVVLTFLIMVLVLAFRPQGLMGSA